MPTPPERAAPTFDRVPVDALRFDPENPRFAGAGTGKSQNEIQELLEREPHLALELVDSFIQNGFIEYEPLVVRPESNHYVVVEGNRRLAAIRHIRANAAKYADKVLPDLATVPVLIFPEAAEEQQRVYLGVRHLFGFREWPAESKARFLDRHISNAEDLSRTLRELNIKKQEVRRYLIPYRLRRKSAALWKPYQQQDFWVLGESLSRGGIKEYLELDIDSDTLEIRSFNTRKLRQLLEFIYGKDRRISETRDLSDLAMVLRHKRAAVELERGRSLDEASLFIESPSDSLKRLKRLTQEIGLLVKRVLTRSTPRTVVLVQEKFKAFEAAVKTLLTDAKKSGL